MFVSSDFIPVVADLVFVTILGLPVDLAVQVLDLPLEDDNLLLVAVDLADI